MQILATAEMRHAYNVENELAVLQDLATIEYMAIDRQGEHVLKTKTFLAFRSKL